MQEFWWNAQLLEIYNKPDKIGIFYQKMWIALNFNKEIKFITKTFLLKTYQANKTFPGLGGFTGEVN